MMDWQPIESAPKDGTDILVYDPTYWRSSYAVVCSNSYWVDGEDGCALTPTHWMPLPAPPAPLPPAQAQRKGESMSKRSGYSIKVTAFIEIDPKSLTSMQLGALAIEGLLEYLEVKGFLAVQDNVRFHMSKDIPDRPVSQEAKAMDDAIISNAKLDPASPLDIPTALRRA